MNTKTSGSRAVPLPASQLARVGRLGSMTAAIAGNMAMRGMVQLGQGQRPLMKNLLLTPQNVTRIADQLSEMRGAAMKIGQLMSMDSGEVLPPEIAGILARLRDDAHFMPPAQLKKVLNAYWPENWLSAFKTFDVRPIAAASIGQVHRVQLKDGRDLAVKIQYPGVADSIDSDVANVGLLLRMSGLLPKGFELAPYLEEARKQLHQETDYAREAAQLARFGALLAEDPQFVVPELQEDWSTAHTLAMTYESGVPIEDAVAEPQSTRDEIATRLIELSLKELFVFKLMQTDPNFANYLYQPDAHRIVLLDFGATREIDPAIAAQYGRLIRAGLSDDVDALAQIAEEIGFIAGGTETEHRTQVVRMIRLVFAALTEAPQLDFNRKELSHQMQSEGIALAESGFVPPPLPLDILLVQRKFGGVFQLAARLGAKVDVLILLDRYLQ